MTPAALEGDLRHFLPSEILQFLELVRATGRLELARAQERAELFLEDGRPVLARTSSGSVRLGELLVHRGTISPDSLERALAEQRRRPDQRLGTLLVASGSATREQVAPAVQDALRRILYGLMLWTDGSFRFVPGPRVAADDLRPELDLEPLIMEGLRQADEQRNA